MISLRCQRFWKTRARHLEKLCKFNGALEFVHHTDGVLYQWSQRQSFSQFSVDRVVVLWVSSSSVLVDALTVYPQSATI